jgi:hypothetical protein
MLETLSGSVVAYEASEGDPTGADWIVIVRDLHTGKVLHRLPTGTPTNPNSEREPGSGRKNEGIGPASAIVVKSDGAVAWIVQASENGAYQVHAVDNTGSRVLADSAAIDPKSLALAGSTLYWIQGAKPMSATLK